MEDGMRTNIELDDALVEQAIRLTGLTTKREVVDLALRELVQRRKRRDLLELVGKVTIPDDYDYKALRAGRASDD
jgi:Arc/MetJ family transcription regulator